MAAESTLVRETSYLTVGYRFTLKLYEQPDGTYRGEIMGSSPPLAQRMQPGQATPVMRFLPTESFTAKTRDEATRLCEERIKEIGETILNKIPINGEDD